MKKLFIAEKPDIGRALAGYLWPKGDYKKQQGYFEGGDTIVSWAYGHILRQATPEEYDEKYKFWKNYPIIPQKWQIKPSANTKKQLDVILKLLKDADIVINAGDPDREGQLLIDEILDYAGYKGTVQRLLLNAKDEVSLKRAFENIQDNSKYKSLYMAGLGRTRADWLVGMNLTRAYSVSARKYGYNTIFRIGRVKIPTLALVVNREKEIKNFKSTKYYELIGSFTKDNLPFKAQLKPSDKDKLTDAENRIKDKAILQAIKLKLRGADITVKDVQKKKLTEYPPLPYSLDTLQVEANKKYGFSPKTVLDTVQQLYEKKFVSYPRSDCNYIPEAQREDSAKIFSILDISGKEKADLTIKSKAWNDKKITAHHAIIPTIVKANELDDTQQKIYDMIAKRYILQFFPPCTAEKTTFTLSVADEVFTGSGQVILDVGFKAFEGKETSDINILPALKTGDKIDKGDYLIQEKETTPPKRFTEGTLLAAMANIYKFVAADNPNREKLKEVKGIGTPATRDTIIAELQETSSKGKDIEPCLKKIKKELVPTHFGINLIENVDKSLTYPDTTAEMEYKLAEIAEGKQPLQQFLDDVIKMVYDNIKYAENKEFPIYKDKDGITCPICGKGQIVRKYSAKIDKHFHMCNNPDCVSPVTGKKFFFEDDNGKPIMAKCPNCKNLLVKKLGKNGEFWLCPKCNKTYNDKNGKPEI